MDRISDRDLMEIGHKAFVTAPGGSVPQAVERRALYDAGAADAADEIFLLREALSDLCQLHAQDEIGCVPAPSLEQRAKAWASAEELVRQEP